MTVVVPPSTAKTVFEYNFDVKVKDAITNLRAQSHLVGDRYGLYWPRSGMWLEDSKSLFYYELRQVWSLQNSKL